MRFFCIVEGRCRLFFLDVCISNTHKSTMTVHLRVINVAHHPCIFFFCLGLLWRVLLLKIILPVKWHVIPDIAVETMEKHLWWFLYLFSGCSQLWNFHHWKKERLLIWAPWRTRCCLYFFFSLLATDSVSDFLLNPSVLNFLVLPEKIKIPQPYKMIFILS